MPCLTELYSLFYTTKHSVKFSRTQLAMIRLAPYQHSIKNHTEESKKNKK